MKPPARFIRPVPGHDHSIEFQNLLLEAEQLSTQCAKTCTHDIRHPFIVSVGNNTEQFLDTFTPNRCNDAEFGKVSPNRIDASVCWRINKCRVRCSTKPLCCSGVLIGTNRMLALVTASQIASASPISFFCRLT